MRKKSNTKNKNDKRGTGRLQDYIPGIGSQEFDSQGLTTRIKGCKTGRQHYLLSTLELNYFLVLDWVDSVVDIREQFPLDLKETVAIAKELAIPHPPKSDPGNPVPLTTDFVVTIQQPIGTKDIVRTVKYSADLTNSRVLEKFEIERRYWGERKIDWGVVTELDIDNTLVENLRWLYKYRYNDSLPASIAQISPKLIDYLISPIQKRDSVLIDITKSCDEKFGLISGNSLALVRFLIASKQWRVDMSTPIQPEKILNFVSHREAL